MNNRENRITPKHPTTLYQRNEISVKTKHIITPSSAIKAAIKVADPLTDFMMRHAGWPMSHKTDEEAWELAEETGWEPLEQFFDEPARHHCMTVARLKQ